MNTIKNPIEEKTELIKSKEFENALIQAANVKKDILTVCKDRNKNNYLHFYDVMLMSRPDIQSIMSMKKKNRSEEDKQKLKNFKKDTSSQYKKVCSLLKTEELEEGEETKFQKMVKKVAEVVQIMDYIGHHEIEEEFKKYGIALKFHKLEEKDAFANESIKEDITVTLDTGKKISEDIEANRNAIKDDIFQTSVPVDLQFDKQTNPTGIKNTDFCKLVDIQTKILMATDDDQKEKIDDSASKIAGDCEFTIARNKIIQSKLTDMNTFD